MHAIRLYSVLRTPATPDSGGSVILFYAASLVLGYLFTSPPQRRYNVEIVSTLPCKTWVSAVPTQPLPAALHGIPTIVQAHPVPSTDATWLTVPCFSFCAVQLLNYTAGRDSHAALPVLGTDLATILGIMSKRPLVPGPSHIFLGVQCPKYSAIPFLLTFTRDQPTVLANQDTLDIRERARISRTSRVPHRHRPLTRGVSDPRYQRVRPVA